MPLRKESSRLNSSGIELHAQERGQPHIYGWDAAMKHHCGVCYRKMKSSCILQHMVLCPKYHATLFIKGHEHTCRSCRESEGLLNKQAREIIEIGLRGPLPERLSLSKDEKRSSQHGAINVGIKKREKKAAKERERVLTRRRGSLSLQDVVPSVVNAVRSLATEGYPIAMDEVASENEYILRERLQSFERSERDAKSCGRVLSIMGVRCAETSETAEDLEYLHNLTSRILDTICSTRQEIRGDLEREAAFRRFVGNRTADSMKEYMLEAAQGHNKCRSSLLSSR